MRDLLSKRIKRHRDKNNTVFDNYLLDYIDVYMTIAIVLVFRLVVIKTVVVYCEWDYISFWTDWHDKFPPPLYMFLGCYLICAFWVACSIAIKTYPNYRARLVSNAVRMLTLILTIGYSIIVILLVNGHYEWGRYEDYGYIANPKPSIDIRLDEVAQIRFVDDLDPEALVRLQEYERERNRCPKYFEPRDFYRYKPKE